MITNIIKHTKEETEKIFKFIYLDNTPDLPKGSEIHNFECPSNSKWDGVEVTFEKETGLYKFEFFRH